jgi:PAS domain S-box-containing protein
MIIDQTNSLFEDIVETIHEPLLVLDSDLKVLVANHSFINSFKVTQEETLGTFIYDLGNRQWDIPKLRELLETILPQQATFDGYEVEHDFATIGRRTMLLNARQIQRGSGKDQIILLAIEDITERKMAEELLLEKKKLQGVLEMAGAICHEMSQPLQVISGFSSILLMDVEDSDPLYKTIKGIEAGITRADMLMKRVMGITRYQSKPYLKTNIVDIEKASQHEKKTAAPGEQAS